MVILNRPISKGRLGGHAGVNNPVVNSSYFLLCTFQSADGRVLEITNSYPLKGQGALSNKLLNNLKIPFQVSQLFVQAFLNFSGASFALLSYRNVALRTRNSVSTFSWVRVMQNINDMFQFLRIMFNSPRSYLIRAC